MAASMFATVADLEARWRGLSQGEQDKAQALLSDASAMIKATVSDISGVPAEVLRMVTCSAVRRAMASDQLGMGDVSSQQMTAGPFSQQVSFANPSGNLYLTRGEKRLLGVGSRGRSFSVDLLANRGEG